MATSNKQKALALLHRGQNGEITRQDYFKFIEHDLDDYSGLVLTEEEMSQLQYHMQKLATGSTAMIPLFCVGPACPFSSRCVLSQMSKAPIGKQCHPPGTIIYTTEGYVAIEALKTGEDKIVTYANSCGVFRKRGRNFQITTREYNDEMIQINGSSGTYHCTKDHICVATWNPKAENLFAVYLMQKGNSFRVGKTQLFRRTGDKRYFGLSSRAQQEQCDKIWVLGVYETNTEALLREEFFSVTWQIPKACFIDRPCYKKTKKQDGLYKWVTQEQLDAHHVSMLKPYCYYAEKLAQHGLSIEYPFWDRKLDYKQLGSIGKTFEIRACNLISGYMDMLGVDEQNFQDDGEVRATLENITIERYIYEGLVYSLETDVEHTYVANGIVTHNCLVEVQLINHWVIQYMNEYEVDPDNFTEVGFCNELSEIEVMLRRLNMSLSKPENAELIIDQSVGVSNDGTPIIQKQLSPFMEQREKLLNRKSKIIKLMVGDRQEQYKKAAALKQKDDSDPSSKMADMRRSLEALQRGMVNARIVDGELIQEKPKLTPEAIIASEDE